MFNRVRWILVLFCLTLTMASCTQGTSQPSNLSPELQVIYPTDHTVISPSRDRVEVLLITAPGIKDLTWMKTDLQNRSIAHQVLSRQSPEQRIFWLNLSSKDQTIEKGTNTYQIQGKTHDGRLVRTDFTLYLDHNF